MGKTALGMNVLDAAKDRIRSLYSKGRRIVLAFSGGKDSTVVLELLIEVARECGTLPVECFFSDEEIIYPETDTFITRTAARPEVKLRWFVREKYWLTHIYNRRQPFFRGFDQSLSPDQWVRPLPKTAELIGQGSISQLCDPELFPGPGADELVNAVGVRVLESNRRRMAIFKAKGFLTQPDDWGTQNFYPIYDWTDGDVWLAIKKFGWDYNKSYNFMHRGGINRSHMRIGPPTLTAANVNILRLTKEVWPEWYEKVCDRLPGLREGLKFGEEYLTPSRRLGETWQECANRSCIKEAPPWIAERVSLAKEKILMRHAHHSSSPLPEVTPCPLCPGQRLLSSWRCFTKSLYYGDPFSLLLKGLGIKPVDPFEIINREANGLRPVQSEIAAAV